MTRDSYKVTATREEGWWVLEAPEVSGVFSQSRRLDQAEDMARDAIASMLDVPEDSFDVVVEPRLPEPLHHRMEEALKMRGLSAKVQSAARSATDRAVREMHEQGLPVRDIGRLLGLSHQRAAKLLAGERDSDAEKTPQAW